MANEQIEEITPGGGGGGNPLIPVIIVLVLMPVISFGLTKFVFIPQIQSAVTDAVVSAAGGEIEVGHSGDNGPGTSVADSGGHGTPATDSHGGGSASGDGHGGSDETAATVGGTTYEFEGIIANLSGSSMNRYVRVSFIIEGSSPDFASVMEANRVKLIDSTITVLSSLTSLDLQNPGIKNHVRSKLMAAFDAVLKKRMVEGLYFSEFVVQ